MLGLSPQTNPWSLLAPTHKKQAILVAGEAVKNQVCGSLNVGARDQVRAGIDLTSALSSDRPTIRKRFPPLQGGNCARTEPPEGINPEVLNKLQKIFNKSSINLQ